MDTETATQAGGSGLADQMFSAIAEAIAGERRAVTACCVSLVRQEVNRAVDRGESMDYVSGLRRAELLLADRLLSAGDGDE